MAFGAGGGGPIASAFVEVLADTSRADREIDQLIRRLRGTDATVTVDADTRDVTRAVDGAVDAADTSVELTGDGAELTGDVTSAVDAGDSTVILSGDASELTGDVTAAVDAGDGTVRLTGDASQLTGDVTNAVNAADTDVEITGNARGVTGSIDAAVDAADTTVQVTGDASGVVGVVDQELQENSPFGPVSIDGGVNPNLLADMGTLVASLGDASDEGRAFGLTIQALATGAVAAGLAALVGAASELEQAVGGTEAVFGAAGGGVSRFAQQADEAAGLTEESARTLTSQLGGLLQGMGFTEQESGRLSVTLAQLGADLAATFGGTSQDAVQALGAAIRGETDPIERYGISLNQAAVGAKAVELGLAASADEMDLNARAQATLAILTERSANAQGQFAREANTTAGQLERFKAEAGNAAAEVGSRLQPSVNDLIAVGRRELIPMLSTSGGELADLTGAVIGLAAPLLQAAAPALGSTATLLGALTPAAEALADVVEAIPTPVLTFALSLGVAHRALGLIRGSGGAVRSLLGNLPFASAGQNASTFAVGMDGVATKVTRGSRAMGALRGIMTPTTLATAAFAGGLLFLDARQQAAAERAENLADAVRHIREETEQTGSSVTGFAEGLELAAASGNETGERFTEFAETVGLSTAELTRIIQSSGSASDALDRIATSGNNAEELVREFDGSMSAADATVRQLGTDLDNVIDELISTAVANGELTAAQAEEVRAAENQLGTLNRLVQANQRAEAAQRRRAETAITALQAQGLLTNAEVQEIQAITSLAEREQVLTRILEQRQTALQFGAALQERFRGATGRTAEQNRLFASSIIGVQRSQSQMNTHLSRFAQLAGGGAIAAGDLEQAAVTLGVPMQDLQFFIDNANRHMSAFVTAATGNLPSVSAVAQSVDEGFSLQGIRDQLALSLQAATDFGNNLQFLVDNGLTGAASLAAQAGPEVAAALVSGFREGDRGVVDQINLLTAGLEQQVGVALPQKLEGMAPQVANGMGLIGLEANRAFGSSFNPVDPATTQLQQTIEALQSQGGLMGQAGDVLAQRFSGSFGTGLDSMPQQGQARSERTLDQLGRNEGRFGARGLSLGGSVSGGFGRGVSRMPDTGFRWMSRSEIVMQRFRGSFGVTGGNLGDSTTRGFDDRVKLMRQRAQTRAKQSQNALAIFRGAFTATGGTLGAGATSGLNGRLGGMGQAAANNAKKAQHRLSLFGGAFRSTGGGLGGAATAGLRAGMEKGTAPNLFDPFVRDKIRAKVEGSFRRIFGISSPARAMIPIGQNILRGVMVGISNESRSLDAMVRGMQGVLAGAFGHVGFKGGAGVERWRGLALQALKMTGSPLSWIGSLLRRMNQESGGNPRAINLTDINAQRGDPSMGLMQNIGSAFASRIAGFPQLRGRSPFDPLASIVASIVYANKRYGIAPRGWDRPGGYERGTGFVPRTGPAIVHRGEGILPTAVNAFLRREGFPLAGAAVPGQSVVIENVTINVPAGVSQPSIYGSRVARGFQRGLRERQIRVDARIS